MTNNLDMHPVEAYVGARQLHKYWPSVLVLGILLVLLGVMAIFAANYTTFASIMFLGSLLTIGGFLQIVYAFWGIRGQGFAQSLLSGIFYTIVGLVFITHPNVTALAITLLLAAFYTVSGIFKIVVSVTTPVVQWGWLLFSGIISLALGLFIWAEWPSVGMWLIGLFIGIDLITIGWFWIILSLMAKKLPKRL